MASRGREVEEKGYATDIITSKSINWLSSRNKNQPFFLMCHHKPPQREWELFDCEKDPLELFNLANDKNYNEIFSRMKLILTEKMLSIGDIPAHD